VVSEVKKKLSPKLSIRGKVVSGAREASFFTDLPWVKKACWEKLGFLPYPGTLNCEVSSDDLPLIRKIKEASPINFVSPEPNFCDAKVIKISLGETKGALVFPAASSHIHRENVLEIIAPVCLRNELNLNDGAWVDITVEDLQL